jgi:hydrogenase maturation factor
MDNNNQAEQLLKQIAPDLVEIKKLMLDYKVEPEVVEEIIRGVGTSENSSAGYLQYPIVNAGLRPIDVMRALYLLSNIKRFARYGKVVFLMQDGKVVRVQQEQGYTTE